MTAEVGILNKQGVVLAADSAVTIGGKKVYNTTNKLFTLGPNHFIGLMVYGNAEFMNHPWSIIFEAFGRFIGRKSLKSTQAYAEKLVEFVRKSKFLQDKELQTDFVIAYSYEVLRLVFSAAEAHLMSNDSNSNQLRDVILSDLQETLNDAKHRKKLTENYSFNDFSNSNKEAIKGSLMNYTTNNDVEKIVVQMLLEDELFNIFNEILYNLLTVGEDLLSSSGIVVAGYGNDELFPSVFSFDFYCTLDKHLVYSMKPKVVVGPKVTAEKATAAILPFAQDDVAVTLLNGISPQMSNSLFKILSDCGLPQEQIRSVGNKLSEEQNKQFIRPMVSSIASMNIRELADVAETLVNVTEFKRKYTSEVATVGGPIDVLAINCAEGPIWIKQKHYFELDNNLDFQNRRKKR